MSKLTEVLVPLMVRRTWHQQTSSPELVVGSLPTLLKPRVDKPAHHGGTCASSKAHNTTRPNWAYLIEEKWILTVFYIYHQVLFFSEPQVLTLCFLDFHFLMIGLHSVKTSNRSRSIGNGPLMAVTWTPISNGCCLAPLTHKRGRLDLDLGTTTPVTNVNFL